MRRAFSAVILGVLGVVLVSSCAKESADSTVSPAVTPSAVPTASAVPPPPDVPVEQMPPPTSTAPIAAPRAVPTDQPAPRARPKALDEKATEPQKKPSPVGISQTGHVVRFTCPNGEVSSQVMGGCMCGSEIANPCGPGVRVPDLRVEGKTCLFTCP